MVGLVLAAGTAGCAAVDDLSATLSKEWSRLTAPDAGSSPDGKPSGSPSAGAPQMVPRELIGLDQRQVQDLFGTAARTREAPPAVVWEYRLESCALDIFFYLDLSNQRFRALAYDMKSADGKSERTLAICLDQFRQRAHERKG